MAANADDPSKIRTVGALTQRGGKSYAANWITGDQTHGLVVFHDLG